MQTYMPEKLTENYGFPVIEPVHNVPNVEKFIEFDYCMRLREGKYKTGVHFFEDDYKFERIWTSPSRYGEMLAKFPVVLGPDFSQYIDMPKAIQIYNHYRNNWLVSYWQTCYNICMVPTVMWGMPDSYDWCFDGYPKNSVVAVSSVGVALHADLKKMFLDGYNEMMRRLQPEKVLVHSRSKKIILPGNVEYIPWTHYKGVQTDGNR